MEDVDLGRWISGGCWKGVVVGLCSLWSAIEPSQNRERRARSLIIK